MKLPHSNNVCVQKWGGGCKVTCYGCGNEEHIKPNCSKLQQGGPKTYKASEYYNAPVAKRDHTHLAAYFRQGSRVHSLVKLYLRSY
jgi:hypothetical protein